MMGFGLFSGGFMFIFWGALIALTIWGFISIFRNDSRILPPSNQRQTPKEILDERYARGDISKEQYNQAKDDLNIQ